MKLNYSVACDITTCPCAHFSLYSPITSMIPTIRLFSSSRFARGFIMTDIPAPVTYHLPIIQSLHKVQKHHCQPVNAFDPSSLEFADLLAENAYLPASAAFFAVGKPEFERYNSTVILTSAEQ
jgi:hypothetical protein